MRKISLLLVVTLMFVGGATLAKAHDITAVRSRSICHYEERYYVWTPGEQWKVLGRLRPTHAGMRVVLQRSKYGENWRTWKRTSTEDDGRFRFAGIAPDRGSDWWVNLRVVAPAQRGHDRAVGQSMYIDANRYARCV